MQGAFLPSRSSGGERRRSSSSLRHIWHELLGSRNVLPPLGY
jgi:hypothetical protein